VDSGTGQNRPLNIFRTLWHAGAGIVVFVFVYISRDGFRPDIWILLSSSTLLFLIEIFRLKTDRGNRFFWKWFGFLTAGKEKNRLSSSLYYSLSLLICSAIYPREAMLGAVVCLALGDPAAIIVGKRFGRIKIRNKSLEGGLANFFVCLLILVVVLPSIKMAFAGALAGAFIELMPLPVDDNITIPLFAGGAIALVSAGF
jgi:glycerol-3-phosphate acyltransferase PlsY